MYYSQKNDLSNNDFLEWLKLSCFQIEEEIENTIDYYQLKENEVSLKTIEKAKDKCKDLSMLLNKYKLELFNGGFNESDYLAYKKELKDAFDFDLTKEKKELVENHLEIKKEFLDIIKIEAPQQKINSTISNSFFIENTSFEKFNQYLELHIVEPYVDYSYLFQRMLKENIIVRKKHLDFTNWLFTNRYITENIKDLFIEKGSFRSLSKSYSTQRENNFNNVFNL
ncbi:hypothetical protein [Flavobacterium sp.]|uniref:hypothetical protein n=1 Tax=Flavobacterium sp. TaxID=239 RepID=UPI00352772AF